MEHALAAGLECQQAGPDNQRALYFIAVNVVKVDKQMPELGLIHGEPVGNIDQAAKR